MSSTKRRTKRDFFSLPTTCTLQFFPVDFIGSMTIALTFVETLYEMVKYALRMPGEIQCMYIVIHTNI